MQAPPRDRSPAAPSREDVRFRIPIAPFLPIMFALVIGMAAVLVAMVLLPLFGAVGFGANALNDRLVDEGAAFTKIPHFPEKSTIYASDGSVLARIFLDENRNIVRLSNVSEIAQKAVLAIEDDQFYEHGPINVPSVIRAMLANLAAGRITQGGSTISQQLVKRVVLQSDEQTFARKFQEAALAIRLEERYSKDEILELYLNEVYFGSGVYGIGTASRYYFSKPAAELTLAEGALLAGLIQSPETFNPLTEPAAALDRRNLVIDRMAKLEWITPAKALQAKVQPIVLGPNAGHTKTKVQPFFVYYIKQLILDEDNEEFDEFGNTYNQRLHTLFQGGLKIYTTLDPEWESYAQETLLDHLKDDAGPEGAIASVDVKTGAIRTMLSGRKYEEDQKDLVWHGRRQTGSAFKPYTLVAAFRQGIPPGQTYSSASPIHLEEWDNDCHCVYNAEGASGGGAIDLWSATAGSVNVVFAQLVLDVGPENVVDAAHDMGIRGPLDAVPSITLGAEEVSPLDMASAYATLANHGRYCEPFAVARVELPGKKRPLYQHEADCEQVISPTIANLVTAMLQRVVTGGTGTAAALPGRPVAGKTGTQQDYTNLWFVGYTPQVSTAVWVGFQEGQIPLDTYYGYSVFGGTVAAPIWHDYMVNVMAGQPVRYFAPPPTPPTGSVPSVVGLTLEEANDVLAERTFGSRVQFVDSIKPRGTVEAQSPPAGTSVELGSTVTLSVSNGHAPTLGVPDVVGLTMGAARAKLQAEGLPSAVVRVDVADPALNGVVLIQTPAAGREVEEGTTVKIQVGRYKA